MHHSAPATSRAATLVNARIQMAVKGRLLTLA